MKLEAYSEKHGKEEKAKKKQPAGAKNASEAPPNAAPAEG